jgi:anthranilate/para-aminobenzoate synthase component II
LIIDKQSIPSELEITATSEDGTIMGVKHRTFPVNGIQFHPESILTNEGRNLIKNWMQL